MRCFFIKSSRKKLYKNNKSKISAPTWNEDLNYLIYQILYQIFKTILNIS